MTYPVPRYPDYSWIVFSKASSQSLYMTERPICTANFSFLVNSVACCLFNQLSELLRLKDQFNGILLLESMPCSLSTGFKGKIGGQFREIGIQPNHLENLRQVPIKHPLACSNIF